MKPATDQSDRSVGPASYTWPVAFKHYRKGHRVAVIINRKMAEPAGLPFTIAAGIVGDLARDGKVWVTLELMGEQGLPQMVRERDIVGYTFHQPESSDAPLEGVERPGQTPR